MARFALVVFLVAILPALMPAVAAAQVPAVGELVEDVSKLHVHPLSVIPFAALLLAIAILPLVAGHFWHSNLKKLLVSLGLAVPVLLYLVLGFGHDGSHALLESLIEYAQFIVLLGSLYTISGGIVLEGDLQPSAAVNTGLLLLGAVLANLVGTTGASMLLIRPFLKINGRRYSRTHLPVFFIFLVSNLGGLLTPLGDPPLFLGFLRGVRFDWTLGLWRHWLLAVGIVAAIFFVWDAIALRREPPHEMENVPGTGPLRLRGVHNFVFLAGIVVVTLLLSDSIVQSVSVFLPASWLGDGMKWTALFFPWGGVWMIVLALLAYLTTPSALRKENDFSWGAILEVAVLFIGIFITMVPALALLETDGDRLGIQFPWQYFWATGALSSFLDNAPTYLSFATLAGGKDFAWLQDQQVVILQAISAGAVFMGANTYIGNGPNFMVKAIADEAGYPTPSFFGYMLYSGFILLPVFAIVTWVFFV